MLDRIKKSGKEELSAGGYCMGTAERWGTTGRSGGSISVRLRF